MVQVEGYEYNVQKICLLITYYFTSKSAASLEPAATVASKYAPPTGHSSNMAAQNPKKISFRYHIEKYSNGTNMVIRTLLVMTTIENKP